MAKHWTHYALYSALAWALLIVAPAFGQPSKVAPPDPATAMPPDYVVRLFLDESQVKTIKGLKRVSVTNPRVADVVVIGPDEIRIDGLSAGRTTMFVWDGGGR